MIALFQRVELPFQEKNQTVLVVHSTGGTFTRLEDSAALLWELLEKPRSVDWLAASLVREYDVHTSTAKKDVSAFLKEMQKAGFVKRVKKQPSA